MTSRAAALLLTLLLGAPPLRAGSNPSSGGRLPRPAGDAQAERVVSAIEARWPEVERTAAANIMVPSKSMSLGLSTKLYQCWQLRLNGAHGLQVQGVLERLKSLQEALRGDRDRMLQDLGEYAAKPDPARLRRIEGRAKTLSDELAAYRTLLESGVRNGLVKASEPGPLSERAVVSGLLRDDDYTMNYDDSKPECPSAEPSR